MPDYAKCCIYKLCCKDPMIEDFYIGSTTNVIKRRQSHKRCCTNPNDKEHNIYKYQFIREHGGWLNWNLVVIEEFSCESKMQKEKIERTYIEKLKPTLNKLIPANYQTGDVYNKQEYSKQYHEANRDKILEHQKEYYEANKDKILEQQKEYKETNRDKIKEHKKSYYQNNKDNIREKACKPYTCECGRTIQHTEKARHFKSKVHQDYISISSSSSSSSKEDV